MLARVDQSWCCGRNLQRTRNGRNAVHTTNQTHVGRTLAKRNSARNNQDGSAEDTSCADSSDRTPNDECGRVGRNTTDQRAEFEDGERNQIDPFDGVESVKLSVNELGSASRE